VTATDATLRGRVNPEGCATTYSFEYGGTTAYGSVTPTRSAGAGTSPVSAAEPITGLTPDTTYHFRIVATSGAGTTAGQDVVFRTKVACVPGGASPPAVATQAATGVLARGANLHGRVDPNGCVAMYHFEYGTTAGYGRVTPTRSAGAGTSPVSAAASITGLAPDTVYHFRIVATSAVGTTTGQDVVFRTKVACGAAPPSVATELATGVIARRATLNGRVDPNGCPTTYRFMYGTTTAYGRVTPTRGAGSGTSPVSAAASITGLAPDTVYHFRIVATSARGTAAGRDVVFRTRAVPALSAVQIAGRRALVRRGFVASIVLRCGGGSRPCQGLLKIFRKHRLIGRGHFLLAANSTSVVSVQLNRRGRRLMRHHRRRRVEVVARSANNRARRFVRLIRTFHVG
jgi:phosphodiesterase/alkaline phosphatase D-like protein